MRGVIQGDARSLDYSSYRPRFQDSSLCDTPFRFSRSVLILYADAGRTAEASLKQLCFVPTPEIKGSRVRPPDS